MTSRLKITYEKEIIKTLMSKLSLKNFDLNIIKIKNM